MASARRRMVVNADGNHLRKVSALVAAGRYSSPSDFVREAMEDKLARVEQELLADEVERYCAAGHGAEDSELVMAQAFPTPPRSRRRGRSRRRATR